MINKFKNDMKQITGPRSSENIQHDYHAKMQQLDITYSFCTKSKVRKT